MIKFKKKKEIIWKHETHSDLKELINEKKRIDKIQGGFIFERITVQKLLLFYREE